MGIFVSILAIGFFAWWVLVKPPSGETIVKEMITAAGGLEQWNAIKDGSFIRTHRLYDENGKIIKQSEETFFFKDNPQGRQLMIRSKTNEGDQVIVGRDKGGFWALMNEDVVEPKKIAKELEFMCDGDECSPLCASEMAL